MFSDRLTLIQYSISVWGAERTDRSVSSDICRQHDATESAGKFVKNLLGGKCEQLDNIRSIATACRQWVKSNTLSYSTSTVMVPNQLLISTLAKMREFEQEFNLAVEQFMDRMETLAEEARVKSGTLFENLPPVQTIRSKFSFSFCPLPMPDVNDFDRSIGVDDIVEDAKQEMRSYYNNMFISAERDIDDMLDERIESMISSMRGKKPCSKAIVNKTNDILSLAKTLNIRDSDSINRKIECIRAHLNKWSLYRLNESERETGARLLENLSI